MIWIPIAAAAFVLAFANGANDNSKGVATLIGSRLLSMKRAINFSAVATFAGSITAVFFASVLLSRFSGKGIVDDALVSAAIFPLSVGIAAAITVLSATRLGMPISTTHALVGAIVGVGIGADALHWSAVGSKFFLPLLLSPAIALLATVVIYTAFRFMRQRMNVNHQTCICINERVEPITLHNNGTATLRSSGVTLTVTDTDTCKQQYTGRIAGVGAQRVLDVLHIISAGALSFARGLNDTPKIAALMLVTGGVTGGVTGASVSLLTIGVGIALGGILAVRRVARTMSYQITEMNDGQAFSANLVSATLVTLATLKFQVPVSTTHTSCGSLFGIGMVNRKAHWAVIGRIVLAWITTLPVAGLLGWTAWQLLR